MQDYRNTHRGANHRSACLQGDDFIRARLLRHFPELVASLGGKSAEILETAGIEPFGCEEENAVTCAQWILAMETAAARLGLPDFGMRLARRQGGQGAHAVVGRAMRHSPTFGAAIDQAVRHSGAHSRASRIWRGQSASRDHVFVGHDLLISGHSRRSQSIEQLLLLGHLGAQALTSGRVRARAIHLRHNAIASPGTYRRNFGCDVRFVRDEDGIVFRADDMACPVHEADRHELTRAVAHLHKNHGGSPHPASMQVRAIIMPRLWMNGCNTELVASLLGMHPRTLNRRLREEGLTFQRIKDEVRADRLLFYLEQTDLPICEISQKLGFAEQSALSHFSRQVFAMSPTDLRTAASGRPSNHGNVATGQGVSPRIDSANCKSA
ncbi:AraC family transcriptional regulator [Sphingomonas sp. IC081]|uniref:AraC family transcriptional regulator n=1 Tax=Sphingomonas sp. IC081 TaxID=304378 RepID=UPI001156F99A|nr:AraC family transcriptional regulator [Sphingomonas sp. IC081]QDK35315.1 AraC family transcriptional regulator [Sphingomonas sp. IC081]